MTRARFIAISAAGLLLLGLAVAAIAFAAGSPGTMGGLYRVDAIFDTAKGIVPGQLVKVAGARAGTVEDVSLTPEYRARLELSLDPRFAGFRTDATCAIQPEGLIGENFVQCDPGTPDAAPLAVGESGVATLPVERTRIPVNISDLFQIWTLPVRQRLPLVVSTLGAAYAARGEDVNAIIRRANPALESARQAIRTVRKEGGELTSLIDSTDQVAKELSGRRQETAAFLDSASSIAKKASDHTTSISEAIRRAPALLAATRPALDKVELLTDRGTPILRDLRRSAPGLTRFADKLEPVGDAAKSALPKLSHAVQTGRHATQAATPVAGDVGRFARLAAEPSRQLADTFASLEDRGFVENLLRFVYNFSAASARYDGTSHLVPLLLTINQCSLPVLQANPACNAGYTDKRASSGARAAGAGNQTKPERKGAARPTPEERKPAPESPPRADAPAAARPAPNPSRPSEPAAGPNPVQSLLDFLLK
jgi:ABC-type transporter Mla subunit MlaD